MATTTSYDKRTDILNVAHGECPGVAATDDEKGTYSFARYTIQGDHYVGFYQSWVKTILFLLGRQWLKWMSGARRYVTDTSVPPWRQQPVTNITYAIYRTVATKLTKQKPALEVVPPSGDSDDRESAALASSILDFKWRDLKIPSIIRRGIGWFLCTGQVFLRVHWDAEAGKSVPLTDLRERPHSDPELAEAGETEDATVPLNEQGEPVMRKNEAGDDEIDYDAKPASVPEGDMALDVVDPLCVRYNPDATTPDDATEMFVATLWPKAAACKHFDVTETELNSGGDGDRQMYDDLLSSAAAGPGWLTTSSSIGWGGGVGASQDTALGDRVLVIEYYSRQNRKQYPNGRHWISIGMKKVWPKSTDKAYPNGESELPNQFWPPLIPVLSTPIPGQPQAMGILTQVVPLNEQYNTVDAKINEHAVMMAMGGKYALHPEDAGLTINSDPGQKLVSKGYALGKPPVQIKLEALPAAIYEERNVIMDKVRLVATLSEAESGKKPEGVSAGRAFLVLQEVTDSVIQPDLEAWEHALEEVGRRMLVLAQRHYREERKIQIRGERGQWEVRSFDGTDLVDGLDVRVQVGSSFPWSKSAQLDTKLTVLKDFPGLVQQPDGTVDKQAFSKYMDVGAYGLSSFESDEDPDLVEIEREHAMFEAFNPDIGSQQLPQLAFWQSHPKHLDYHYRFMKRDRARFDRWHPAAQEAFLKHMQLTAGAVDEIAGTAVAAADEGATEMAPAPAGETGTGQPQLKVESGGLSRSMEKPQLQQADFAAAGQ